jgi:hypothetical protein
MKRTSTNDNDDVPSFELPVENELLMLKLKAEFGAECTTANENIPAAVVNEFLKSVYEFEQKFREPRELIKVYDKIGKPDFRKAAELSDKQLSKELKRLIRQMNHHRLELDVLGEYPDRVIYSFITEEFFEHEMENLEMPGYIHHFCYEEFHPNHEMDIRSRATEFLGHWFDKRIDEYSWELADPFIHPDVFASYVSFTNCKYEFEEVSFEWDELKELGRGYAGGRVSYDAIAESGEKVHYEGPFQFYLSNTKNWWNIFYFIFPGFKWS